MSAIVLTYHSHHVVGSTYALNDHLALETDLQRIADTKCLLVSLDTLVDAISQGTTADRKYVSITFDDGPAFDVEPFVHPKYGLQKGFLPILREVLPRIRHCVHPEFAATSFVIADPNARVVMEDNADPQYTYLEKGSMSEWWGSLKIADPIRIGNHSWDHLHPALDRVAQKNQVRANFAAVDTAMDAESQIGNASSYILSKAEEVWTPYFAFPFGHHNEFLVNEYLPKNRHRLRLRAAFTTEPKQITGIENIWCLPRFTCGHHWKSVVELGDLLESL